MTRYHHDSRGLTPLTPEEEAKLDALLAAREEEYKKYGYIEDRKHAYPPITDYLDGVVKGDQAQIQAYIAACLEVKARFPKPAR